MLTLLTGAALAWTPTDAESAMILAFSARDGAPPCAEVEALVPDPVQSLESVIAHVTMPPWAPMHAAACLIDGHGAERPELLASWVDDPALKGLARMVFHRMHRLEPEQARSLADRALAGPLSADARDILARSPDARVRALASTPASGRAP